MEPHCVPGLCSPFPKHDPQRQPKSKKSLLQGHRVLSGKSSIKAQPVGLPRHLSPRLQAASSGHAFYLDPVDVFSAPVPGPQPAGSGQGRACPLRHPHRAPWLAPGPGAKGLGPWQTLGDQHLAELTPGEQTKRPPSWCLLGNWPLALTVLSTSRFLLTSLQGLRPQSTYCGFSGACAGLRLAPGRGWRSERAQLPSSAFERGEAPSHSGQAPLAGTRPDVLPPQPHPGQEGEGGAGADALIPLRTMSVRGAQNRPLCCCGTRRRRGSGAPGVRARGVGGWRRGTPRLPEREALRSWPQPPLSTPRPRRRPGPRATFLSSCRQLPRPRRREGPGGTGCRAAGGALTGRTHRARAPAGGAHAADALTGRTHLAHSPAAGSRGAVGSARSGGPEPARAVLFRLGQGAGKGRGRGRGGATRPRPPAGSAHCTTQADVTAPSCRAARTRAGQRHQPGTGRFRGPTVRSEPLRVFLSARW